MLNKIKGKNGRKTVNKNSKMDWKGAFLQAEKKASLTQNIIDDYAAEVAELKAQVESLTAQRMKSLELNNKYSMHIQELNKAQQPPAPGEVNILDVANKIIYGDREQAYGNPRFNLDTIAQFWSVYLARKFPEMFQCEEHISAEDVAQLMILLKTARLIHNPTHVDSLTDQAGYAALQNRIQK